MEQWEEFTIPCIVCSNDATLLGETIEDTWEPSEYDGGGISIEFKGESFNCPTCGLVLDDFDELKLAGIETDHDRDDDLEDWTDYHYPYYYYYY